jgi:hypothetical protein
MYYQFEKALITQRTDYRYVGTMNGNGLDVWIGGGRL